MPAGVLERLAAEVESLGHGWIGEVRRGERLRLKVRGDLGQRIGYRWRWRERRERWRLLLGHQGGGQERSQTRLSCRATTTAVGRNLGIDGCAECAARSCQSMAESALSSIAAAYSSQHFCCSSPRTASPENLQKVPSARDTRLFGAIVCDQRMRSGTGQHIDLVGTWMTFERRRCSCSTGRNCRCEMPRVSPCGPAAVSRLVAFGVRWVKVTHSP